MAHTSAVTPQGSVDHRMRAPGSGYAGGPTATTGKGVPANLDAGRVGPAEGPANQVASKVPMSRHVGRFANTTG
jgi:hypothetical protein